MNGVSLFSNVGIAETYVKNHNINIVVANELLEKRANFYKFNHKNTNIITGDITKEEIFNEVLSQALKYKCEFLIATPPCQGMSIAGKMREDDPRNSLIIQVVKFVKKLKPKHIIIENVVGILKASILVNGKKIKIVDYIKQELKEYFINYKVVDTADYETPQTRKRAIFLISSVKKWEFPKKHKKISVEEAISHLPSLESGEASNIKFHYAKNITLNIFYG